VTPEREGTVLLFAASEPFRPEEGYAIASSFHRLRGFVVLPSKDAVGPVRGPSGERRWEFPEDVGRCARLAVEIARSMGRDLRIIDVSRPGEDDALVRQWVRPETLLPMLLAPDGRALNGMEAFQPGRLRAFLKGGRTQGRAGASAP